MGTGLGPTTSLTTHVPQHRCDSQVAAAGFRVDLEDGTAVELNCNLAGDHEQQRPKPSLLCPPPPCDCVEKKSLGDRQLSLQALPGERFVSVVTKRRPGRGCLSASAWKGPSGAPVNRSGVRSHPE